MPQHNVMTKVSYSLKTSWICLLKCRLPHCGLNVVTRIENFVCLFVCLFAYSLAWIYVFCSLSFVIWFLL